MGVAGTGRKEVRARGGAKVLGGRRANLFAFLVGVLGAKFGISYFLSAVCVERIV